MQYKRPKCEYCGTQLFFLQRPYKLRSEIPSNCPDCGKKVSNQKINQLNEFSIFFRFIIWTGFIVILIVVFGFFVYPILVTEP
ncbi:MAG: hypothetical protein KGD73_12090 [Candidatus Lokiarchaeota archaeon]|nr:hypothetical protein [Candidatus Lokiarchaeota archaeon]